MCSDFSFKHKAHTCRKNIYCIGEGHSIERVWSRLLCMVTEARSVNVKKIHTPRARIPLVGNE